jgi:hypothetical protein
MNRIPLARRVQVINCLVTSQKELQKSFYPVDYCAANSRRNRRSACSASPERPRDQPGTPFGSFRLAPRHAISCAASFVHAAELKRAGIGYKADSLNRHGLEETETSITGKLGRCTFAASFFMACLAVLEMGGLT